MEGTVALSVIRIFASSIEFPCNRVLVWNVFVADDAETPLRVLEI